jgi:hypothetical protein
MKEKGGGRIEGGGCNECPDDCVYIGLDTAPCRSPASFYTKSSASCGELGTP